MHLNFSFSAVQTLWTLTFAGLLVLLVVLLGRDRVRRFPWFTVAIVLTALRLLASRLLFGRLAPITLSEIFLALADLALLVGLLVAVEVARRTFVGLGRLAWIAGVVVLLAVAGAVLAVWGPWPSWKSLDHHSLLGTLQIMQISAQKGQTLLDLLTIELGLLIVLRGDRFHGGWRSHPQQIVIGLSTAAIAQLAVEGTWQLIAARAVPRSHAEYDRIMDIRDRLFNSNSAIFVLVLIWWIVCLWMDEPASASASASAPQLAGRLSAGSGAAAAGE